MIRRGIHCGRGHEIQCRRYHGLSGVQCLLMQFWRICALTGLGTRTGAGFSLHDIRVPYRDTGLYITSCDKQAATDHVSPELHLPQWLEE